jgi:hypothetical protein
MEEGARIGDRPLPDEVGPKLARQVELGVDLKCSGNIDAAVGILRGVVQLAVRSMAGTRVVPGLRAFLRAVVQCLEHDNAERWVELLEHRAERRAHDAGADQDDVGRAGDGSLGHLSLLFAGYACVDFATNGRRTPGANIT